jgi:pSer/pThr/pTyr-binding forkhead associated (FHA) protein
MDRGLRQVLSGQISRLHVLLMAERGRVYAMDLCSTNGTWQNGQRIRRVHLADSGTRLILSGNDSKVELTWHPRVAGETPRQPTMREFGPTPNSK